MGEANIERGAAELIVDGEPMGLRGRIDRIEYHPDLKEWAVLDYKTSEKGEPPEKTHRAGRGKDKRWIDLQLPLYRHLLPAVRNAGGQPLVDEHRPAEFVRMGYVLLPGAIEEVGLAEAEWGDRELAEADEAAGEVVRLVRANCFDFVPGTKLRYDDDPLRFLFGHGQLLAGDESDEEGGGG
jgi:hypothetical protein